MTVPQKRTFLSRLRAGLGRIWLRLLLVNVTVVLVPIAGLEFAHIYERQLLNALERDMNNQLSLARAVLESDFRHGVPLGDERHRRTLETAAAHTRTRIRVVGPSGTVVADSHRAGPPEGPEPAPPRLFRRRKGEYRSPSKSAPAWPVLQNRSELRSALSGRHATYTRVAHEPRAVFLFSAMPVTVDSGGASRVIGAVYATRSTLPVLFELYRIRTGLFKVLAVALALGASVTILLALSISRPIGRLSRAAGRIAAGERDVAVPIEGPGEIRELSESFKTMTEQLDARLTYISEFSADVAHEFKSPLTAIRGAAELLAEGAHEDPKVRERFLKNILLDTERLDRLVSRLLVLSRIEAGRGEMTLLDLKTLLAALVGRANETHPVELHYHANAVSVRARKTDLEMAVWNLVENAQRHSPADAPVRVTVRESGRGLAVSVSDEGHGVPTAKRDRIFERFYTTDGERGGTGLGLAIVDSVARSHGGEVTLRNDAKGGACFELWLPSEGAEAARSP